MASIEVHIKRRDAKMPKPPSSGNPAAEGPHIGGAIAQSVEVDASGVSRISRHSNGLLGMSY